MQETGRFSKHLKKAILWTALLIALALVLFTGRPKTQSNAKESKGAAVVTAPTDSFLHAIVTSDLHYTEDKNVFAGVVPGMAYAGKITDAMITHVIASAPDVFIMTGDNTNGGSARDVAALVKKLQMIRDAGIPVIVTMGNHDLDHMTSKKFVECYEPLMDIVERDAASFSYVTIVNDVVFLAMDDSTATKGNYGFYSDETLAWMFTMLEKYADHPIVYLSHHNVLFGQDDPKSKSYRIQNVGLVDLLKAHRVKLLLTGHLHGQRITESDGMYEIVSAMPLSGRHLYGNLWIGKKEIAYQAAALSLSEYMDAKDLAGLTRAEAEHDKEFDKTILSLLKKSPYTLQEQAEMKHLFDRYMMYQAEGTLEAHAEEIKKHPSYEKLVDALNDYNYGPWIKASVEAPSRNAMSLRIRLR